MGGEGHMMEMNRRLKQNRQARRSKRKGYRDNFDSTTLSKQKLKFKEIPLEELKLLKEKIKSRLKRERIIRNSIFWLTISSLIIVLICTL